jgi:DNA-binding response OmpR family regulator
VLLDIMLPGVDGYDVCRMIAKRGYHYSGYMLTAKTMNWTKFWGWNWAVMIM